MMTSLSLILAGMLNYYTPYYPNQLIVDNAPLLKDKLISMQNIALEKFNSYVNENNLKYTLENTNTHLNQDVIEKVLTTLECANKYNIKHNQILTIIDYSLPSNQKRLWVFDLEKSKLLYHTYVGHGIASGALLTDNFSNNFDSKASSIGVYKTEDAYHGREGRSLRLQGLEMSFNHNASNRYIVMHGGWYMDEAFIKKYGRSGRSWGCPAIPAHLAKSIIETIKDNSLIVMYYPSDSWFAKSKFLNCNNQEKNKIVTINSVKATSVAREYVFFAPSHKEKAILVLNANLYEKTFKLNPPLERMLRRRIGEYEYIALNDREIGQLTTKNYSLNNDADILDNLRFVIPTIKMRRGYYITEMEFVNHQKITSITMDERQSEKNNLKYQYTIHFKSEEPIRLSATNDFIRWLGL